MRVEKKTKHLHIEFIVTSHNSVGHNHANTCCLRNLAFFFQVNFPFRSILARSDSKDDRVIAVETQLELATVKASEAENLWQDFERKLHLAEQGAEYLVFVFSRSLKTREIYTN